MPLVYFIQCSETQRIKIGVSKHPQKRRSDLQVANGSELTLLGATAEHDEKKLHARFDAIRTTGEWFKPEHELLEFLRGLGMKPMERKKREQPFPDDHPFIEAQKLHPGEWYDSEDMDILCKKLLADMQCVDVEADDEADEVDDEVHNDVCDYCAVDTVLEGLHMAVKRINAEVFGLHAEVLRETDRAWLVRAPTSWRQPEDEMWLPRSVVEHHGEDAVGRAIFVVPAWLVRKKRGQ